jgi:hypothetical protein
MERAVVDLRTHRGGDRRRPRVPPDRRVGQSALGPRRRRISGATDSRRRDRRQGRQLRHLRTEPRAAHATALVSGSLPIALLFCFASFVRFEATAIYSEEAKDKRTVPRAAFLAVIVIGAVYMRRRRICHCDASFRPQLGRARISPSWKGWAQRSPESATSSDDQSVAGTVRPATNTDRISFLDRRERSVPQPQPRWAGVHPQAGDATGLEMRSVSTEFVALLDRDHCARTTPTRPTGWRNDSPPASAAG